MEQPIAPAQYNRFRPIGGRIGKQAALFCMQADGSACEIGLLFSESCGKLQRMWSKTAKRRAGFPQSFSFQRWKTVWK